jgi:hypothetical protein
VNYDLQVRRVEDPVDSLTTHGTEAITICQMGANVDVKCLGPSPDGPRREMQWGETGNVKFDPFRPVCTQILFDISKDIFDLSQGVHNIWTVPWV